MLESQMATETRVKDTKLPIAVGSNVASDRHPSHDDAMQVSQRLTCHKAAVNDQCPLGSDRIEARWKRYLQSKQNHTKRPRNDRHVVRSWPTDARSPTNRNTKGPMVGQNLALCTRAMKRAILSTPLRNRGTMGSEQMPQPTTDIVRLAAQRQNSAD